jgi:hypothetical protein
MTTWSPPRQLPPPRSARAALARWLQEPGRRGLVAVLAAIYGLSLVAIAIGLALGGRYPTTSPDAGGGPDAGDALLLLGLLPWFSAVAAVGIALAVVVNGAVFFGVVWLLASIPEPTVETAVAFSGPWDPDGHYAALGLGPAATRADVRRAYRLRAQIHHPDHGGDLRMMQAVNAAWDVLGDPGRRAAYDARAGRGPGLRR